MKTFWGFCAGAAVMGMAIAYSLHSPLMFAYNAVMFLLDLWYILYGGKK